MKHTLALMVLVLLFVSMFFSCAVHQTETEKIKKTVITVTTKKSGGSSDTTLKTADFQIATLEVEEGDDNFKMAMTLEPDAESWNDITGVTVAPDSDVIIKYFTSSDDKNNPTLLEGVGTTLYVGTQTTDGVEGWVLKLDLNDKTGRDALTGKKAIGFTVTYDGNLVFTDANGVMVTSEAHISYTRNSAVTYE